MSVAKVIEISATSTEGFAEAVKKGITKAEKTVHNIEGAWIKEQKVVVDGGTVTEFQVVMKVTFVLE